MNRSNEVEAWLDAYENPMRDVVRRVRDIILRSDHRIAESIKWQAPTFSYRGNLASFFPHSKKHASLMVHTGGEIPGHHPRLEGSGETARVMKIASVAEANAAKDDLRHLVRAWCDWRDAEGADSEEPAATAEAERSPETARAPAAKKARKPTAKKARKPAPKKAKGPAAKKAKGPAAKKARKPTTKKARPRKK